MNSSQFRSTPRRLLTAAGLCLPLALPGPSASRADSSAGTHAHSVRDLVQSALASNQELAAFAAAARESRAQSRQAAAWNNPELAVEFGGRRATDATGVFTEKGNTFGVSLVQTFEFPGKASLRKAIAARDAELAELGLLQFRLSLENQVRLAALRLQAATALADLAGQIAGQIAAMIDLTGQRPAAGPAQALELRLLQARRLEFLAAAAKDALARDEAAIDLRALAGLPASTPLRIRDAFDHPSRTVDPNRAVLAALAANPQIRVRTAEAARALAAQSAARLEALPGFKIGPFFSRSQAGDIEEDFGVTFAAELPLWNLNAAGTAAARAAHDRAVALVLDARRKVERETLRRCRAYAAQTALLAECGAEHAAALRDAAESADRQYRLGAIGTQLYLDVQRQFLDTERLRHETILAAWEHWLDLDLLTAGTLRQDTPKP